MHITREEIVKLLKEYRVNQSVLALQQRSIRDIKNSILNRTQEEVIESLAMSINQFGDIPLTRTNEFYSRTETAALGYMDKVTEENKDLVERVMQLEIEIQETQDRINLVQNLLKGLKNKNKYVIRLHCFEGFTLEEISTYYCNKYRLPYVSRMTIINKYNEGINTMVRILGQ
jgi:DNA-directed RNA polymerase specialized sigma subunit